MSLLPIGSPSSTTPPSRSRVAGGGPASGSPPDGPTVPTPVDVVTFNTAGDKAVHTPEALVPDSPVFQRVVQGAPDAPIIACQETTPVLAKKLIALSKNGNFQVIWPGHAGTPGVLDGSPFLQGNLLLVPKRYEVLHHSEGDYNGRAGRVWHAFLGWVTRKNDANTMLVKSQRRGLLDVTLKDRESGKTFSVIATHLDGGLRLQEAPRLAAEVQKARSRGPVVVMGDFNTPTNATNRHGEQTVAPFWKVMDGAGLTDAGPTGPDVVTDWMGGKDDIDHVLTSGFTTVSGQVLDGTKMTIPGRPDAKGVSDHYAKEVQLAFGGTP